MVLIRPKRVKGMERSVFVYRAIGRSGFGRMIWDREAFALESLEWGVCGACCCIATGILVKI